MIDFGILVSVLKLTRGINSLWKEKAPIEYEIDTILLDWIFKGHNDFTTKHWWMEKIVEKITTVEYNVISWYNFN